MSDLYKGIFWITDIENPGSEEMVFRIPVTPEGEIIEPKKLDLNSRNEDNYNHKLLWESLPSRMTHNKPYNYYPRGRVEIRRKKATIYLNPDIAKGWIIEYLLDKFGLSPDNVIDRVIIKPDGSEHYRHHPDSI